MAKYGRILLAVCSAAVEKKKQEKRTEKKKKTKIQADCQKRVGGKREMIEISYRDDRTIDTLHTLESLVHSQYNFLH